MTEEQMKVSDVYWNNGTKPIFINVGVIADPNGGPGRGETTILVAPGQGIDLSILGMGRERLK